jgi:hypothetical protein
MGLDINPVIGLSIPKVAESSPFVAVVGHWLILIMAGPHFSSVNVIMARVFGINLTERLGIVNPVCRLAPFRSRSSALYRFKTRRMVPGLGFMIPAMRPGSTR